MKSLKVLATCSMIILLTSMQCNTRAKQFVRYTAVDTQVEHSFDSTTAKLRIDISYSTKELPRKTDSVQFIFSYSDNPSNPLIILTDKGPFRNNKKKRFLEDSVRIIIPQSNKSTNINVQAKIFRKSRYLASEVLSIQTVYSSTE